MSKIKLLVLIIDLILIHTAITVDISSNVHHVTSSSTSQCSEESCLTLSMLAANSSNYLDSNTMVTMAFLEGNHTLDSELVVSNIDGSLMLSTYGSGTTAIICSGGASLVFRNITLLQINGLKFIRCSSKVEHVDQFTLENSRFHGGDKDSALHLMHTNTSIVQSFFMSNTAGTYQGHVEVFAHIRDNYYTFPYPLPNIQSNSARVGGALIVTSSIVNVKRSHFESNTAKMGGAIYLELGSIINISNCTFINNSATGCSDDHCHGGALFIDSGCTVTAHNSTFMNNTAGYGGGAIALFQGAFLDTHNVLSSNIAGSLGGAIFAYSRSRITINKGCYSKNRCTYGGAIYLHSYGSITVGNSSFNNNEAKYFSGVMHAVDNSSIIVGNSSFDNNKAGEGGGVISVRLDSCIHVGNSSFDNNVAGCEGGVIYAINSSSITVCNSSFDGNIAGYYSGVIHAVHRSNITVSNSSFDNNEAGDGGGVMSVGFNCRITVGNSSFDNNVADYSGGVMYATNTSNITVGNSSFDNNIAGHSGGVMSADFYSSITVGNSSFEKNEVGNDGGVMYAYRSKITVGNSSFDKNKAGNDGGVMYAFSSSSITIGNSSFNNNEASSGGVIYAYYTTTTIFRSNCSFFNNSAHEGGVVYIRNAFLKDLGNTYFGNKANTGGVIILYEGDIDIFASSFLNNTARNTGGVLCVPNYDYKHHITLAGSIFNSNRATSGGVIALLGNDNLTVTESAFSYNNAIRGGAIYLLIGNKLTVKDSNFSYNSAKSDGGVIYSEDQNILTVVSSTLNFNSADNNGGVVCSLFQTELIMMGDSCTFIGNRGHRGGVVYASESRINVYCQTLLMANNTAIDAGGAVHLSSANITFLSEHTTIVGNLAKSGGATFATESQLIFSNGSYKLVGNQADYGGAIHASESILVVEVNSWTNVSTNLAMHHGGGLYITMSELNAKGYHSYITKNQANSKGGGIHADNSSIIVEGTIHFTSNKAENGGAISLERNAKLKGMSYKNSSINLISNKASRHGGALYVDDKTNLEMCAAITTQKDSEAVSSKTECFSKAVFISFSDNFAGISGSNLFGGLFDRCTVHRESYQKTETNKVGLASFQNSSNVNEFQLDTVNSHPVRLCFCRNSLPDCNYQPESIKVNRGKAFLLQLIAYNHISKPIRAAVDIHLSASGLVADRYIDNNCTDVVLQLNLFTHVDSDNLTLSVIGPCNVTGFSTKSTTIKLTCTCPIGFQMSNNNEKSCECVCDRVLQSYEKTECNPTTESIIRRENFWISYMNNTSSNSSGYIIYPHCPFDYCYIPNKKVSINLNMPNGSDEQCDSNRMGMLCGTCKPSFSVSLGSSKCLLCPTYWPGLFVIIAIVFILSGIGLVALVLALNLTVAIGTLNAVIFYANIVAANKSTLFPSGVSFASVFISWLNFDTGFDICFLDGMDTYIKTWLQLAFPAYIIILVAAIIKLSYYFSAFGRFLGKKDPVATLATLILLSYAKFLQTIITAFSFATVVYPDGSKKTLWLPDASIKYFTSKHAVLFFTAIAILLVGLIYTLLLFSWQWFPCCPRKQIKWIRNQKLISFIEIYLIPYTPKHRYWTGLLLIVRISVYLVSAFNPSGDPKVTLSATNFIISSLVIYIAIFRVRMYNNHFINTMETLTYFNIMVLATFTWYTIDANTNQAAVTNISVGITFIQLIVVILYHTCKHTNQKLFAMIQGSVICIKMKERLKQKRVNNHKPVPDDKDIHLFHELLDMIDRPANTNDYNIPQVKPKPIKPTQSVVELPKPLLSPAISPPLEAIKKEPDLESEEQESEQSCNIDVIPVEENLSKEINKNKQCINN